MSKSTSPTLERATELVRSGQSAAGVQLLENALGQAKASCSDDSAEVMRASGELASVLFFLKEDERAAELLERADASWDQSAQREALRLYEEALSYRPGDASIQERASRVALELGDLERSIEYAEAAVELAPDVADHHVTLARALRRDGRIQRACDVLETALTLDPDHEEARAQRGVVQRKSKRIRSGGVE